MKKIIGIYVALIATVTLLSGCFTPSGLDSQEQKQYAKDMANASLTKLYKYQPEAKAVIDNSVGYVVYNTYTLDYFFLGLENGWGVAVNNRTGKHTYLKDLAFGLGPGLGYAVMRNILVFNNETDFNEFVESAWSLNLKADAVARFTEDGTWHRAGALNITDGARMYKIGHRGLIAEAIIDLGRNWRNRSLVD